MSNTPGPWRWDWEPKAPYANYLQPILYGSDGKPVCSFGDGEQYYPTEGTPPSKEDAKLIAAAPDLLATLQWVLAQQLDFIECAHGEEIQRRVKAAIEQVTSGD